MPPRALADRFSEVRLLFPKSPGESRTVGKEGDLLHHPAVAVRVMLFLRDDATFRIPLTGRHGHGFAADAASADQVACLGVSLAFLDRALEVLPPECLLSAARQKSYVVRGVLVVPELIVRGAVGGQAADQELAAAPGV